MLPSERLPVSSKVKRVQVFEAPDPDAAKKAALAKQPGWKVQWVSTQGPGKWLVQVTQ